MAIVPLCELTDGQEADFYALLSRKELKETQNGKPYYSLTFRDIRRTITFPLWESSPYTPACKESWKTGMFFKIRGVYELTKFGPQVDLIQIREVNAADRQYGFSEEMFLAHSQADPETMFEELLDILKNSIGADTLYELCETILMENKPELLTLSAASHNHHAFVGGWLEHTLNVVKNAVFFAERYTQQYPALKPPLDIGLIAAGAALHDIGKLEEIALKGAQFEYTTEGHLLGHMLLGRDIVRDACHALGLEGERFMLLEHIIIAHQRLPEWGAPKPPMIPEALLVHYADDVDAKFAIITAVRDGIDENNQFSPSQNSMGYKIYRAEGDNSEE